MTALIGATPGADGFHGTSPIGFNNVDVPVYVIFYDKPGPGNGWTTTQKNLVIEWLNNIDTTPWWSFLRDYPSPAGGTASAIHFVKSTDDPEIEGTALGTVCQLVITNAIADGGVPADPIGHYMVIPNDTAVTAGGNLGFHSGTGIVGTPPYSFSCYTRPTTFFVSGNPPNGDVQFDSQMIVVSHEIAESLSAGWTGNGGVEVADECELGNPDNNLVMSHGFTTTVSSTLITANLTFTDGTPFYYWAQDIWSLEQGGHCVNGQTPPNLSDNQPCLFNLNCSWSKVCNNTGGNGGMNCGIPTCSDGIKNQNESDIDCGATCGFQFGTSRACANGKHCFTDWDCLSSNCVSGICAP